MGYTNPILPGFNPDPSICRVGRDYYLVTSSFEFFPGVPIYHSRDLVHWKQIGHCLTRESQAPLKNCRSSGGIYAPTLRHRDNVFYMTTTNTTGGGNFYVTATDPAGPWSEPFWVGAGGIDPSFFFDDDSKTYYLTSHDKASGKPISLCEIDLSTGNLIGESRSIWPGTGGSWPEGPHLYKKDGWYYIMIAEGGTEMGHMETIARSRDIWGPYDPCPQNPILSHRYRNSVIQGTGHADLVQAHDGSWWMVFLAFRNASSGLHHLGRETFLAPVTWNDEGWPVVNGGHAVTIDMDVHSPLAEGHDIERRAEHDGFDGLELALPWNFLRSESDVHYSLTDRPGKLLLWGNRHTLDDVASPAFIGRRQADFDFAASVSLDVSGLSEGEEAGMSVLYNEIAHYDVGVVVREGTKRIRIRKKADDMDMVVYDQPLGEVEITLLVMADRSRYHFGFGKTMDAAVTNLVASGVSRFLSTEVYPMTFTGVYVGMYATGNGHASANPAVFDDFTYAPGIYRTPEGKTLPYRHDTPIGTFLRDPVATKILEDRLPGMMAALDRSSTILSSALTPRLAQMIPGVTGENVKSVLEEIIRL